MRKLTKILTGVAAAAAALTMAIPAAHADPINKAGTPITPAEFDLVGVGSDSIQYVSDQLTYNYDWVNPGHTVHNASNPNIYSWDATKPGTVLPGGNITTKADCAQIVRPDGSTAGISTLALNVKTKDGKYYCVDYARSSRARESTDPPAAPGGVLFVTLATDAVSYATTKTTNAPSNLTTGQLTKIYTCSVTNWDQVGGKNAPIKPFIPQSGSGTRAFFLSAIGVTTPGSCVNQTVQENEGVNSLLNSPDVVVPYSVGSWLAQKYHSAACFNTACNPVNGKQCNPTGTQNKFGCDADGVLVLNKINNTVPYINIGTPTHPNYVTNPKFTGTFIRTLYDVVRWESSTATFHMGAQEAAFFGPKGYYCTNSAGKAALVDYGFMNTPFCGQGS
jgi:ABC-type phosphate transport system substrate-binding protein